MRLSGTLFFAVLLSTQTTNNPSDRAQQVVGRLDLNGYKAHIKGLSQFGDRIQGSQRNRDAIDWLEKQLRSFGYRMSNGIGSPQPVDHWKTFTPQRSARRHPGRCTSSQHTWMGGAGVRQRTTTRPGARLSSNSPEF